MPSIGSNHLFTSIYLIVDTVSILLLIRNNNNLFDFLLIKIDLKNTIFFFSLCSKDLSTIIKVKK